MKIHNPKYLMASYRFNGTIGDTNGKILDVSKHNRHIIYSPSGDPMYTTNDLGKSNNIFKNGYPIAQRLDKVTSTGLPVDRIGSVGLPTFTNNGCKRWDGDDRCVSSATLNIGAQDFEMGLEMRLDNLSQSKYRPYFGRWSPDGVDYAGNVAIHQSAGTTVYAIVKSHEGTQAFVNTNTASLGTTLFHTFLLKRVGTTITFYIDGVARGSATYPATDTFMVNRKLDYRGGPCTKSHAWVDVAGVRVVDYTHAAGPALVEWDRSGNGNHGVYTTTSGINTMAIMDDNATPWNTLNGFSLYTHATLPVLRVPYDINGDPLSITPPTGYSLLSEHPPKVSIHNGAESTLTQTDTSLLTNTFWSSDGITFDDKTYDDIINCDGSQGVYVSKEGSNITEILTESFNGNDPNNIDGYSANLGIQLGAFTIFGTFKCNDVYSSRDHSICALYDISDNLLFKVKLVGDVDKYLVFTGSDDGIGNSSSNIIVNDKNIHSFACTFDGENWNIYIDGDFNSTEVDEYSSTETIVLKVGKCDSDSFLGNIGNIKIYNTVLEANDIQLLHVEAMNPPMAVAINGTPLEELIETVTSIKLGSLNDPLVGEWLNDPLVGEWLNDPLSGASLSGFRVVLGTIDGFNDYSGNSNEFTVSGGIIGNGIILNNGNISWDSVDFTSYSYVFEPMDGTVVKFCSYSEGVKRINMHVVEELPFNILATGVSNITGKIHKIELYNKNIPYALLKLLYMKESRYF